MEEEKQNRELTEDDFDDEFYNDENNSDSDYEYSDENKKDEPEESENDPEEKKDTEDTDDILKASETEKGNPDENNASFLNRNMLFITVGSIFIVFLFFCVFILPNITKRKVAQNNEREVIADLADILHPAGQRYGFARVGGAELPAGVGTVL